MVGLTRSKCVNKWTAEIRIIMSSEDRNRIQKFIARIRQTKYRLMRNIRMQKANKIEAKFRTYSRNDLYIKLHDI